MSAEIKALTQKTQEKEAGSWVGDDGGEMEGGYRMGTEAGGKGQENVELGGEAGASTE